MLRSKTRWIVACGAVTVAAAALSPASAGAAIAVDVDRALTGTTVSAFDDLGGSPLTLSIQRGGVTIASTRSAASFATLATPVAVGDVIRAASPVSQFTAAFDGRPVFGASVCGTTRTFSGLRSGPTTGVEFVDARLLNGDPYSPGSFVSGTVTGLSGESFSGIFARPISPGFVIEALTSQAIGGGTLFSGVEQLVGACPVPPAQPPIATATAAPIDRTAPTGRLAARLLTGRLRALLSGRASTTVVVNEPGVRIAQALYLANGARLPTTVRAAARRPRLTLIARGSAVSRHAGAVRVRLRPTAAAKRLRRARSVRLAVVTTLRDAAGNVRRLPVRRIVVRR
jgi:hypothetical protein